MGSPSVSFDASSLDLLPPDLREAMEVFFDEQVQREAVELRERNLEYQDALARTLIDSGKGWQEICSGGAKEELDSEVCEFLLGREGAGGASARKVIAANGLFPSLAMFYRDLYGIERFVRYCRVELGQVSHPILVNHRDREHPYEAYEDLGEFMRAVKDETSFIYMGRFWTPPNGYLTAKRNAMTTINGFCVDLDRVEDDKGLYFQPEWVMNTLLEKLDEFPEVMPNYLMLSGTGIQLWYVFGEAIPLLSAKPRLMPDGTFKKASPRRDKFQRTLRALYEFFDRELPKNRFRVDVPCATISHPFRAPASPSKYHYPTRLFVLGGWDRKMADPLALSDFLGCDLKPYDLEDWNQEEYERIRDERDRNRLGRDSPATEKQLAWVGKLADMGCLESFSEGLTVADADALIKKGEIVFTRRRQRMAGGGVIETTSGHQVPARPRDPGLYRYTLRRLGEETPPGSRYNALFGLAGLGWNCGIPKKQVERDMLSLLGTEWARKPGNDGKPLEKSDIKAAMSGWNRLGALRPREQLEDRLRWSYGPSAKRNGRRQIEHLARARSIQAIDYPSGSWRNKKGAPEKRELIREYALAHPGENHSEMARALGVSRSTVVKWLKPGWEDEYREFVKIREWDAETDDYFDAHTATILAGRADEWMMVRAGGVEAAVEWARSEFPDLFERLREARRSGTEMTADVLSEIAASGRP